MHRLMVVDGRDAVAAQEKLAQGREKHSDHEWMRFRPDAYADPDEAYKSLVTHLRSPAMFAPGRVVYCFGQPVAKDHLTDLAKQLPQIDDTVSFIIVCQFEDLGTPMTKAIKAMEEAGTAKVFPAVEVDKKNVLEWTATQAEAIGLQIDKDACRALAEVTLGDPTRIQNELRKLRWLTSNNIVTAQNVMTAAFGEGEAEITQVGDALLFGRMEQAHELLQRILDRGESPLMIGGYLEDWATRLAIAESCGGNSETVKMKVAPLMKWESSSEGQETVYNARYGTYTRPVGKRVPMFGNPNAFYYTCRGLRESGRPAGWALKAMELAGKMQLEIRMGKDAVKLFHGFLAEVNQGV